MWSLLPHPETDIMQTCVLRTMYVQWIYVRAFGLEGIRSCSASTSTYPSCRKDGCELV